MAPDGDSEVDDPEDGKGDRDAGAGAWPEAERKSRVYAERNAGFAGSAWLPPTGLSVLGETNLAHFKGGFVKV